MYWFTSDEHHGHSNIIKYSDRPFSDVNEMDEALIDNHNKLVTKSDITVHAGDFSFYSKEKTYKNIISRLNGKHIFLKGDHDRWLGKTGSYMWLKKIDGQPIIVCHYCMKTWWLSHYNSWQLFGHSHGGLSTKGLGKQIDIGVDNNAYSPISFTRIKDIMNSKPNNFNYIDKEREY